MKAKVQALAQIPGSIDSLALSRWPLPDHRLIGLAADEITELEGREGIPAIRMEGDDRARPDPVVMQEILQALEGLAIDVPGREDDVVTGSVMSEREVHRIGEVDVLTQGRLPRLHGDRRRKARGHEERERRSQPSRGAVQHETALQSEARECSRILPSRTLTR